MKKLLGMLLMTLALFNLSGCSKDLGANDYDQASVGDTQTVDYGVIVDAQKVQIRGNSGAGGLVGAGTGAVAGSFLGGDSRTNILGAIGGGVIGAFAGNAADKKLSSQVGVRYIVKLQQARQYNQTRFSSSENKAAIDTSSQSAKTISIVQGLPKDKPMLSVGQRVMILDGGTARARVIPDNE